MKEKAISLLFRLNAPIKTKNQSLHHKRSSFYEWYWNSKVNEGIPIVFSFCQPSHSFRCPCKLHYLRPDTFAMLLSVALLLILTLALLYRMALKPRGFPPGRCITRKQHEREYLGSDLHTHIESDWKNKWMRVCVCAQVSETEYHLQSFNLQDLHDFRSWGSCRTWSAISCTSSCGACRIPTGPSWVFTSAWNLSW